MNLLPAMINVLGRMENKPVLFPLVQEVAGSNLPKSLASRTGNEALDTAAGQFGGTLAFFGSGIALDFLLKKLFAAASKGVTHPSARMWRIFGMSVSIYAVQGALYWAVPFLRNALTLHRTGSHSFTELIGQDKSAQKSNAQQAATREKMHHYLKRARNIVGVGALISAVSTLAALVAIRRGLGAGKLVQGFVRHMGLGEGSFKNYPRWAQFFFIAVASYAGWIDAVRDRLELKEQLLQFASFLFGWFVPPLAFERLFKGRLKALLAHDPALLRQVIGTNWQGRENTSLVLGNIRRHLAGTPYLARAERLFAAQHLTGLGVSVFLLSLLPQGINILLAPGRVARSRSRKLAERNAQLALAGPVQRKHPDAFLSQSSPFRYSKAHESRA